MDNVMFRGLRTDGEGWVYGSFIHNSIDCPCIIDYDAEQYEVIPETVGQYTGRDDKNGVKIFGGDQVKWTSGKHYWEAVIKTLDNSTSNILYAVETYNNLSTGWKDGYEVYTYKRNNDRDGYRKEIEFLSRFTEVIGNIHESDGTNLQ